MATGNRNHITSKWAKTIAVNRDPALRSYIPDTRRMNASTLRRMLERYGMVYIKPNAGTFGSGVMRVERTAGRKGARFTYQVEQTRRTFGSFDDMYRSILRTKRKRPYLAQKGIHLLKTRGRSFDIRVMVQRNPRRQWETTGIIGRVAHPRKIVTNYHSGGTPKAIEALLPSYVGAAGLSRLRSRMSRIGRQAAEALGRAYPGVNMVGADIGLDASLKPWIIELNTKPDPYLFRHLKNKATHYKVLRYARALRRIPGKR